MRLVVDLTKCQGYAQCIFLASEVFTIQGDEALSYDPNPGEAQRTRIRRAAAACPVQAIRLDQLEEPGSSQSPTEAPATAAATGGGRGNFKQSGRIVIAGASLAGLSAAERLREEGFTGSLTLIGEETYAPYDRPPLSKQVLAGVVRSEDTSLPRRRVDVVDDLAYPLPVTVICELLGVPPGDEQHFHVWVDIALQSTDPGLDPETQQKKRIEAGKELRGFMQELVDAHRRAPGTDLLSAMATDDGPEGRMPDDQLVSTGLLLLIAGHETTVNPISNGALTLLRHPAELLRLRTDPGLVIPMVEVLLRYEPPVHFVPFRTALDDIDIAGTTIPAGASLTLVLAAGNRDPAHLPVDIHGIAAA